LEVAGLSGTRQIIKRTPSAAARIEFGTELVAAADRSLVALLGAPQAHRQRLHRLGSPGKSFPNAVRIQRGFEAEGESFLLGRIVIDDAAILPRIRADTAAVLPAGEHFRVFRKTHHSRAGEIALPA